MIGVHFFARNKEWRVTKYYEYDVWDAVVLTTGEKHWFYEHEINANRRLTN